MRIVQCRHEDEAAMLALFHDLHACFAPVFAALEDVNDSIDTCEHSIPLISDATR
jgi:hypothetical protein